ncbi:hypothetical protein YQE_02731, partial [Dendroctonus ponderosae]
MSIISNLKRLPCFPMSSMHSSGVSVDQGINEFNGQLKASTNISRMRKRFHDLLDDTFSLFGNSRKGSPTDSPVDDRSRPIAIEVKSHSANDSR